MGTDKATASGSETLTQDELKALLDIATAAKRDQAFYAPTAADTKPAHWGNTDYGRMVATGVFAVAVAVALGILCGGVALIINALR